MAVPSGSGSWPRRISAEAGQRQGKAIALEQISELLAAGSSRDRRPSTTNVLYLVDPCSCGLIAAMAAEPGAASHRIATNFRPFDEDSADGGA